MKKIIENSKKLRSDFKKIFLKGILIMGENI